MAWEIEYLPQACDDLKKLDHSVRVQVLKAIVKVSENPLPQSQGGLGKPLGNHQSLKLSGYLKIKLLKIGIRVVYRLVYNPCKMKIVVISARNNDEVYKIANFRH